MPPPSFYPGPPSIFSHALVGLPCLILLPPTQPWNQFALPVLAGLQIEAPQQPLHASPCLEPCAVNMYS
jgi:hypothetical protein